LYDSTASCLEADGFKLYEERFKKKHSPSVSEISYARGVQRPACIAPNLVARARLIIIFFYKSIDLLIIIYNSTKNKKK
jgi:hypothetical protein